MGRLKWVQVGRMLTSRYSHAVSDVTFDLGTDGGAADSHSGKPANSQKADSSLRELASLRAQI